MPAWFARRAFFIGRAHFGGRALLHWRPQLTVTQRFPLRHLYEAFLISPKRSSAS
jgi:hypothetical protein